MKFNAWIITGSVSLAVIMAISGYFAFAERPVSMDIGGRKINVEVVRSPSELRRGLSGRDDLPRDSGMLFILPERGIHPFWMKDMRFALDIIWLDDGEIVEVATLPAPTSTAYIPRHEPFYQANRVLEVKAGMAQELGLKPGFRLILPE